jgi:hypothetical protein
LTKTKVEEKRRELPVWGGECKVHRPLFRDNFRESTMSTDLFLQVALVGLEFRASAMFTDLSSQIPLCRCQVYQTPFTDP